MLTWTSQLISSGEYLLQGIYYQIFNTKIWHTNYILDESMLPMKDQWRYVSHNDKG